MRDRAHNLRPFAFILATIAMCICRVSVRTRCRCLIRAVRFVTVRGYLFCSTIGVHPSILFRWHIRIYGFVGVPPSWPTSEPTTALCPSSCLAKGSPAAAVSLCLLVTASAQDMDFILQIAWVWSDAAECRMLAPLTCAFASLTYQYHISAGETASRPHSSS